MYETFYVLDLDRTLFDTVKAIELMKGVIKRHDGDLASRLEQRFEDYSISGESFSMRDFIAERVNDDEMAVIEAEYKKTADEQDLLNPGAIELLSYIRAANGVGCGILTFGSDLGQKMKIDAVPQLHDVPFLVTKQTHKGAQIAGWRGDDGRYNLPKELGGGVADTIVFVDDKPFSFDGILDDCRGYLVKSVFDAGVDILPPTVVLVDSLYEVLSAERGLIDKP